MQIDDPADFFVFHLFMCFERPPTPRLPAQSLDVNLWRNFVVCYLPILKNLKFRYVGAACNTKTSCTSFQTHLLFPALPCSHYCDTYGWKWSKCQLYCNCVCVCVCVCVLNIHIHTNTYTCVHTYVYIYIYE